MDHTDDSVRQSDALVLFGITGDLARKKIFPMLYEMSKRGGYYESVGARLQAIAHYPLAMEVATNALVLKHTRQECIRVFRPGSAKASGAGDPG